MAVENYLEHSHLTSEYLQPFQEGNMSDFNGAKPVMTIRDDEFKIKIVDGQSGDTATSVLSVVQHDTAISAGVNDIGVPVIGRDTGDSDKLKILPFPMPVTDNGGSLTVDATDLDIRALDYTTDSVTINDNGGSITVDATDLDIRALDYTTDSVTINDNGGSITVDASDLDIRDLTHASDSIKVGDGTDFLAVNSDGSINVVTNNSSGTLKSEYATEATVGVNSEIIKFFSVTNLKTAWGKTLLVGARGSVKVRFGLSSNGTSITTVKGTYFQDPKENYDHNIEFLSLLGDGTAALAVGVTNLDAATSDIYWNIQYREV